MTFQTLVAFLASTLVLRVLLGSERLHRAVYCDMIDRQSGRVNCGNVEHLNIEDYCLALW